MNEPEVTLQSRTHLHVAFEGEFPDRVYAAKQLPWSDSDLMHGLRTMFWLSSNENIVALEIDEKGIRAFIEEEPATEEPR
jgi:hypothetical protein